jgi:Na+-transporting NADH:ubiquinone oxidoreductase subunit NqrF
VTVKEGGGDILPTELSHITKREAKGLPSGLPGRGEAEHED